MSAIKIKVKKATGDYDLGCSKMLGSPTVPQEIVDELPAETMFLMQIRLEDIKDLDKENLLPHKGYLYVFLDVTDDIYDMHPIVKYYDGEPESIYNDFNEEIEGFENFVDDFIIEFEECEDDATGNKLLGCAGDWQFGEEEGGKLFLQIDPLDDNEMGLFPTFDGYIYLFFDEEEPSDFDKIRIVEDFS